MFKDVKRWDGAVIGTEYINATNDIKFCVSEIKDENITLDISFEELNKAPFAFIQEIAVVEYKILDASNNEILNINSTLENAIKGNVENGKVVINLPIKEINLDERGEYKILINNIYGLAKVEQPLKISGMWECEFAR